MALATGTRIGPYEIVELLGAGGMGEVYRALDPRLGRRVAIKVLLDRFAHSPDRLRRFEREARAASALSHPNVLTVFDVGTQDGIHYLVSELLEGQTFQSLLRSDSLDLRQSLTLVMQVAQGVACAHEAGILHRDLKPENLFLTRDGRVKILDFGVVKLLQPEDGAAADKSTATGETGAGSIVGTVAYMAPEQIRDEPLDGRCDVFALGSILYEMLAKRPAFTGKSASDVMAAILRDDPPPVDTGAEGVPPAVELLIRRCLAKQREDRLGSARELSVALETLLASSALARTLIERSRHGPDPLPRARPDSSSAPTVIAPGRRRWFRSAVVAGIGVAALGAFVLFSRWRAAPTPATSNSLAVMYFENLSDRTDADNLGRMLAALVTTELGSSDAIQVLSSQRLSDIARQLGKADGPDHAVATEVARRAGAATMVLGQVMRAGPRMVATAELVDVTGGQRLASYRAEGTTPQDVFSMAAGLASQLRTKMTGQELQSGPQPLTDQLTSSIDAYRAYVRGETLIHRWEWEKAADAFRQAVKLDPDFALGHYRLAIALSLSNWGSLDPEGRVAAELAAALKQKLPPRERAAIDGAVLVYSGRRSDAVPVLEASLARDPDNKELLYLLSECYMHAPREINPRRATELLERLLVLDPDFRLVYLQLAMAYAVLGEFGTARERLDGWEAKEPESVRTIRALVSFLEGRVDEAVRLSDPPPTPTATLWRCYYAMYAGRWDIVRGIIADEERQAEAESKGGPVRPRMRYLGLAIDNLNLYHGQFGRIEAELRDWASKFRPQPIEAAASGMEGLHNLADLAALKGDVQAARSAADKALLVMPDSPYCLYVAGVFAIRASDLAAAERHLRTLAQVAARSHGPLVPHYRAALEAEIALAQGRPADAQPLLERAVRSGMLHYEISFSAMPGMRFRDGLARTYLALGKKEKAAEVLEAMATEPHGMISPVLRVRAFYRVGALKHDLGDRVRGREYLQKFIDHWGKSDWDMPEVRDARSRLASSS